MPVLGCCTDQTLNRIFVHASEVFLPLHMVRSSSPECPGGSGPCHRLESIPSNITYEKPFSEDVRYPLQGRVIPALSLPS